MKMMRGCVCALLLSCQALLLLLFCGAAAAEVLTEADAAALLAKARRYLESSNPHKAAEFYDEAAGGDSPSAVLAKYELAQLLEDHFPAEHPRAWRLYNEAADRGVAAAQHRLAVAYGSGMFVNPLPVDEGLSILYNTFAAAGGDPRANAALGYRYWTGLGVPASCETALDHFESAANHAAAIIEKRGFTVFLDKSRISTKKNSREIDEEVVEYYEQLARAGDTVAQISLGNLFLTGAKMIDQNPQTAARFYEMAAKDGDAAGAGQIGYMYARGIGVEPDAEKALKYLNTAVENNDVQGFLGLGYFHWRGIGGQQNMTAAVHYISRAAAEPHNHPTALYYLGEIHSGQGRDFSLPAEITGWDQVELNAMVAVPFYTRAAQRGHVLALHRLGQLTARGIGTARACKPAVAAFRSVIEKADWVLDLTKAYRLNHTGKMRQSLTTYLAMAHLGFNVAQSNAAFILSREYCPGGNATACEERALRLYKLSAMQDDPEALLKVGDFYYYGRGGLQPDKHEALLRYESAAELKHPHALFNLGVMFEIGDGVTQDFHLAKRYYDQAGEYDGYSATARSFAVWLLSVHKAAHSWLGPDAAEKALATTTRVLQTVYQRLVQWFAAPFALALGTAPHLYPLVEDYAPTPRPGGALGSFWDRVSDFVDSALSRSSDDWHTPRPDRQSEQPEGHDAVLDTLWSWMAWDTFAAIVLSIAFIAIGRLRLLRRQHRQNR